MQGLLILWGSVSFILPIKDLLSVQRRESFLSWLRQFRIRCRPTFLGWQCHPRLVAGVAVCHPCPYGGAATGLSYASDLVEFSERRSGGPWQILNSKPHM